MLPSLLEPFNHPLFKRSAICVDILRLDRIDPFISGNKWFKLRPFFDSLDGQKPILSFGGAFSNHLHALARMGHQRGIKTIGVVRGTPQQTPTLDDMQSWGMALHFVSREAYKNKESSNFISALKQRFGPFFLLPEGGATDLAIQGCSEIWKYLPNDYSADRVFTSVGTGTTLAGLLLGAPKGTKITGIAASGNFDYLESEIAASLQSFQLNQGVRWNLESACDLRFAKLNSELAALWQRVDHLGLTLDPVYSLRLFHSVLRMLHRNELTAGERLLLIHTGGLQGLRGQQQRLSLLASAHCGPIPL